MKHKSFYQKMLHDNYHVGKFGPVENCPYCFQKSN